MSRLDLNWKHNGYLSCLACLVLALFLGLRVFNDGKPGWRHIVTSDGRGYYAYLPALLIDQDPTFKMTAAREAKLLGYSDDKPGYLVTSGKFSINKYFAGEALLLLPFFLLAMALTWLTGGVVDGYGFYFQVAAGLGTLFYLFCGLWFLTRSMKLLGISHRAAALAIIAILTGTNLFYYCLWQPTMSHTFSFFAINGFLWFSAKSGTVWQARQVLTAALFFGLVILIRPTNAVVLLLIPFVAGNWKNFQGMVRRFAMEKRTIPIVLLIPAGLVSVQLLIWYLQTGELVVWPYLNEGFRFGDPQILNVLFSYRKGLFVYTPLLILAAGGLGLLLYRRQWLQAASMLLFMSVATYIISSWWNWYYGDGFGLRAFIDYYGVFALLLAVLFDASQRKWWLFVCSVVAGAAILLNLIQTWQYTHFVIHPNSMNREKYCYVFLRTDSAVIRSLGGNDELADYTIRTGRPVLALFNDLETERPEWNQNQVVRVNAARSGRMVGLLDPLHPFSSGIAIRTGTLGTLPASFYIRGEVWIRDSLAGASDRSLIVVSIDSVSGGKTWWQGFRLNDVPVNYVKNWSIRRFSLMTPVAVNRQGILKVYIWNTGKKTLLVDDLRIEIYGSN